MDAVTRHLAAHHSVISRAEARDLGLTDRQIAHRVATQKWIRLAPGVFRHAAAPLTWRARVRGAVLSTAGLASHGTAATLHRVDGWDQSHIELVVDQSRRPKPLPGVTIHRSTQMNLAGACEIDGVPVTGLARTALDVAASVGKRRLNWTIDSMLRGGEISWPDLYQVLARSSAKGRDGCGKLRRLLDERYGDKVVPDSKFNRLVGQLLEDCAIEGFVYEYEIYRGDEFVARADLAFPDLHLAIECDSKRWHLNAHAFEADRHRQNRLTISGWTVLQFTWDNYVSDPAGIADQVYNALRLKLGA